MSNFLKAAPIPFQGQKRNFANQFSEVLKEMNKKEKIKLIVDLFGGSGLLSHISKRTLPEAQVIYNDFDNYSLRLQKIKSTNELLNKIRNFTISMKDKERIESDLRNKIIECIKSHEEEYGYVDYITLSASIIFSGKYVTSFQELTNQQLYNRVRKSPIIIDESYLEGIDILRQDYNVLFKRYENTSNTLFLVDPPYLSTDVSSYTDKYWKLADYLNVLNTLKGNRYVYFTSNKSSIIELMDWFSKNYNIENPFGKATIISRINGINKTSSYIDYMIYK